MKDVDLIWECLIDKSYKDKIQLELLLNKIEDRKLAGGFLFSLFTYSEKWGVDINHIIGIMSTYFEYENTPNDDYMQDAFSYFQTLLGDKNKNQLKVNQFTVDFLTIVENSDKETDFILSEIDTTKMEKILSKGDKNSIQHLKDKLLKMEKYEILPLIDKYL